MASFDIAHDQPSSTTVDNGNVARLEPKKYTLRGRFIMRYVGRIATSHRHIEAGRLCSFVICTLMLILDDTWFVSISDLPWR